MRIAVMQAGGGVLDVTGNLALMDKAACEAAVRGADVLVTPELFACGYAPAAIAPELTIGLVGRIDRNAAEIALRHGIHLVYSVPSPAEGGGWHISAVLLDRGGVEVLRYHKVHLFGSEEQQAFVPGSAAPSAADLGGMPVGLAVCYDAEFPETVRALADAGAAVALIPTALGVGFGEVPQLLLRARALESQLAIAYANHLGPARAAGGTTLLLGGGSVIISPDGTVLAEASAAEVGGLEPGGLELLVADVTEDDVAAARGRVGYLRDRRPDLYASWAAERRAGRPGAGRGPATAPGSGTEPGSGKAPGGA